MSTFRTTYRGEHHHEGRADARATVIHFVRDEHGPRGVHLFQWVKNVDAYYKEIVDRGAKVAAEPADQPYGIREFGVRDINGVGIVFGQDIESA